MRRITAGADRVVAAQASELPAVRCRGRCFNSADNFLMTRPARLLGDLRAVRFDLNIVFVTARGEEKGMPEPVRCLRGVLADEVCRGVAAIAGRHCTVRRFEPAVELFVHDVAVGAGRRIVSEVGPTPGIREGIDANPDRNADHDANQDTLNYAKCSSHCLCSWITLVSYASIRRVSIAISPRTMAPRSVSATRRGGS